MTVLLAVLLVALVALFVVFPLLGQAREAVAEARPAGSELWAREKAVAVLAITEADFDRATGKLSDDDYQVLRADYEGRALHAMDEMDKLAPLAASSKDPGDPASPTGAAQFCPSCGERFLPDGAFCGACGRARVPG